MIDPTTTLGALVAERPARAGLFERLRLDYCCGGAQTLGEACDRRGLALDAVRAELEALDATSAEPAGLHSRDWRHASVAELCTHIVTVHHDGLRETFPRIEALLATVVRVHGASDPKLHDLQRAFGQLRSELETHLASEASMLFPACVAFERHGAAIQEPLLSVHEREHASVGDGLAALRVLAGGYEPQSALCDTHRALLDALAAFERDLHQHVHKENNVLFPRVREPGRRPAHAPDHRKLRASAVGRMDRPGAGDPSLPSCCQAWIVEQTRAWAPRSN
jgi:regulator of cell morphogenesis and NO signaling